MYFGSRSTAALWLALFVQVKKCFTLKRVVLYFEDVFGTLKMVVWYFDDGLGYFEEGSVVL